jgi:predicted nucleic acid-binding Zn ribbon protein
MSFNSLNDIIHQIEQQPGWEEYQQYRLLLKIWSEIIDSKIGNNTHPLYIARNILWVATSSSTWAQELSLRRYMLLKQLNSKLPFQLLDIRCSSARWHQSNYSSSVATSKYTQPQDHPSKVSINSTALSQNPLPSSNNLQLAVESWAKTWKMRSRSLPSCPQCYCPTPTGELERWGYCYHCIAQELSKR